MPGLKIAASLISVALLAGCATFNGGGGDSSDMAERVEPALRASALGAEASHDYKSTAQSWRTLQAHHPDDRNVALSLARAYRMGGEAQRGADSMQEAMARLGRDADLLSEMGKDYLAANRLGLARRALADAAAIDPVRWDVPDALGICDDVEGNHSEAAAHYAEALRLSPNNPQVLNNTALSQALDGKLDAAIGTLRQANDQPAAGDEVRQNLALLLAFKGDVDAAEHAAPSSLPTAAKRANADIYRTLARATRP